MSREVGEGDNFRGARTYLAPCQLSTRHVGGHYVAVGVETHDLHANGGGAAGLDLVFVTKEVDASFAAAVVEVAFYKNAEHGRFACVDVSNDCYSSLDHFFWGGWILTD